MKFPFSSRLKSSSLIVVIILSIILILFRIITLQLNELSWDVLGYYIHLPALFIHFDHGLNDLSWIYDIIEKYKVTETLYQISSGPEGNPIFFFLMGMSIFYLPWFLIGHLWASFSGYPADGFSLPYQYSLALGVISYTIIGLIYLRKILLNYFSEKITTIVLIIIVLGTNYFHFQTTKNLETANILFLTVTLIIWNSIQWHNTYKIRNMIYLAILIVLTAMVKPSEVMVIFIPLAWGVYNRQTMHAKFLKIIEHKHQFLAAIFVGIFVALPQILYWYSETGHILFDSYKNPGVGLDIWSPHIINILFSFRKGWLIYTPVMIFALVGFIFLYRENKSFFSPALIYSLISFYIIASWTEWWYGASFSIRPMITLYPILAITLGYTIKYLGNSKIIVRSLSYLLIIFFIMLNLFQTWQLNNFIIEPYRMTKKYYFAIFGKTAITEADKLLLAPDLTFNSNAVMPDESLFKKRNIGYYDFEEDNIQSNNHFLFDSTHGNVLKMDGDIEFSPEIRTTFRGLTACDYAWVKASVDVFIPKGFKDNLPMLVLTFQRKEGAYHYRSYSIDTNMYKPGSWGKIEVARMTPLVRNENDFFKVYVWNRSKTPLLIDNLKADTFEPYCE